MDKLKLLEIISCLVFLMLKSSLAGNDLNDLDDELLLTLLTPTKTASGQTLFEGDIVQDVPKYDETPAMKALPNRGGLWTDRVIPYVFHQMIEIIWWFSPVFSGTSGAIFGYMD
ncbi:uncharacterized protein LOC118181403 [Stegodyphus dumicola]|uniref:uncharacterized protein LOC118181403 n=1 Tax=Stegodyphus dumicola TaxID=202533 RepID=UPI0015AC1927|nr:uncharacterized protein LOC118181403 [Stegodyphus dumicola]